VAVRILARRFPEHRRAPVVAYTLQLPVLVIVRQLQPVARGADRILERRLSTERRLIARPEPDYPPAKRVKNGVGAVVMKALVDESGAVTRVQVAGAAGGQEFTDAVTAAARQWRVEKDDDSVAGCQMAREVFLIVAFRFSRD
jgi:TonB family protein